MQNFSEVWEESNDIILQGNNSNVVSFNLSKEARRLAELNETQSMIDKLEGYYFTLPLLGVLVITTNLIVVISSGLLVKKGLDPRCTYLLLGNISLADLVMGIVVITGWLFPKSGYDLHPCAIRLSIYGAVAITSSYSVAMLAIDRFVYIVHGIKYNQLIYPNRARLMIAASWLIGILTSIPPMLIWARRGQACWYTIIAPPALIIATTVVGSIPLLCVVVIYSIILYNALKSIIRIKKMMNGEAHSGNNTQLRFFVGRSHRNIVPGNVEETEAKSESTAQHKSQDNPTCYKSKTKFLRSVFVRLIRKSLKRNSNDNLNGHPNAPSKWKAVKVVIFTTGSFLFTWAPYYITSCVFVFCDYENTPLECYKYQIKIASPLGAMGFINSLLNPIVYAWWHNGFREGVKKLYCKNKPIRVFNIIRPNNEQVNQRHSSNQRSSQIQINGI